MGMSVKALAEHAGVDRGRLAVLEEGGNVRLTTVSAVLRALDELEHEMGMDVPSVVTAPDAAASEPLRFTFHDVFGIGEIIAEGPVDHPDELIASITQLFAEIRGKGQK